MNIYFLNVLRIIHIIAGVLWAGAAISYFFFIKPTVQSLGPAGPQFMQNLVERQRYPRFMKIVSFLTIVAGGALFWNTSGGLNFAWVKTGPGLGFSIGAIASLIAYVNGIALLSPRAVKIGVLGMEISKAGGPPTNEQMSMMEKLQRELLRVEQLDFVLLVIALVTMATARYWLF